MIGSSDGLIYETEFDYHIGNALNGPKPSTPSAPQPVQPPKQPDLYEMYKRMQEDEYNRGRQQVPQHDVDPPSNPIDNIITQAPITDISGQSRTGLDEAIFQAGIRQTPWFKEYVKEHGEEPDLNTTDYDYRTAWAAGARPDVRDPSDNNRLHWPSEFKGDNHPNRFVDGVDTKNPGESKGLDLGLESFYGKDNPEAKARSDEFLSKLEKTWPVEAVKDFTKMLTLAGRVNSGETTVDQAIEEAGNFAMNVSIPGLATAGKRAASAGIFGGGLRVGGEDALKRARAMERKGHTEKEIYEETGMWKGFEGKWRSEIDDNEAFLTNPSSFGLSHSRYYEDLLNTSDTTFDTAAAEFKKYGYALDVVYGRGSSPNSYSIRKGKGTEQVDPRTLPEELKPLLKGLNTPIKDDVSYALPEFLHHPELYKVYPELKDIKVEFKKWEGAGAGFFSERDKKFVFKTDTKDNPEWIRGAILHETQHAVQAIEEFNRGTNPSYRRAEIYEYLNDLLGDAKNSKEREYVQRIIDKTIAEEKKLKKTLNIKHGHILYMRDPGEIEARMVQERLGLPDYYKKAVSPEEMRQRRVKEGYLTESPIMFQHEKGLPIPD